MIFLTKKSRCYITHEEYANHVHDFTAEMQVVTEMKNTDYSAGAADAMQGFFELSRAVGITPMQAWMCLMMKHVAAITRFVKVGGVVSESIHGRFIDLANYAMLGDALVSDLQQKKDADAKASGE